MTEKLALEATEAEQNATHYGYTWLAAVRGPLSAGWIGTGQRVLDLGCRDGTLTRYYAAGNEVVGVDVDRRALELAAGVLTEAHWLDIAREWPFAAASFDVVIAAERLEHLESPGWVIDNAWSTLRTDGALIGSVPNGYNWRYVCRGSRQNQDHKRRYRRSDVIGDRGLLGYRFRHCELVPIGTLKLRVLPAWLMRLWPALAETWAFRSWKRM
jgi:2-polyprenyl-3-methyl-5-hydroxy-6-metoxy-1,4-benzoquinol methylase